MSIARAIVAQECFIILEGIERERKAMSFSQRWKIRKEYKRKLQRVLALMDNI